MPPAKSRAAAENRTQTKQDVVAVAVSVPAGGAGSAVVSQLSAKIRAVLDAVQSKQASPAHSLETLQDLHDRAEDSGAFAKDLIPQLNKILVHPGKDAAAERTMRFLCKFVAQPSEDAHRRDALTNLVVRHALAIAGVKDKHVRFRAAQLIAGVMFAMADDAELEDAEFQGILDRMTERCRDQSAKTREQAVIALARMQDATSAEDPVIQQYLRMLAGDPSKEVRATVLAHIGVTELTLEPILARTKDVEASVRRAAFQVLRLKVPPGVLSVAQRAAVLRRGLGDRDASVVGSCVEMLADAWLSHHEYKIIPLLGSLNVDLHKDLCEQMLRALWTHKAAAKCRAAVMLRARKTGDEPPFLLEPEQEPDSYRLSPERALFWRVRCTVAHDAEDRKALDALIPDVARLCKVLDALANRLKQECTRRQDLEVALSQQDQSDEGLEAELDEVELRIVEGLYVMQQLLQLSRYSDLQDEAGRKQLSALLNRAVLDIYLPQPLVGDAIRLLRRLRDDLDDEAFTYQTLVASQRAIVLPSKEEQSPEQSTLEEARILGGEFGWLRLLTITAELQQHTTAGLAESPFMQSVLERIIEPSFAMEHPLIRQEAVRCLGLFLLSDRGTAFCHLPLLARCADSDVTIVRTTALQAVFDILMVHDGLAQATAASAAQASDFAARPEVDEDSEEEKDWGQDERISDWTPQQIQALWWDLILDPLIQACREPPFHTRSVAGPLDLHELEEIEHRLRLLRIAVEGVCKLLVYDRIPLLVGAAGRDLLPGNVWDRLRQAGAPTALLSGDRPDALRRVVVQLLVQLLFLAGAASRHSVDAGGATPAKPRSVADAEFRSQQRQTAEFIQQCLSVFFPAYVKSDLMQRPASGLPSLVASHLELCVGAYLPLVALATEAADAVSAEEKLAKRRKPPAAASRTTKKPDKAENNNASPGFSTATELLAAVSSADVATFVSFLIGSAAAQAAASPMSPMGQVSVNRAVLGLLQNLALSLVLGQRQPTTRGRRQAPPSAAVATMSQGTGAPAVEGLLMAVDNEGCRRAIVATLPNLCAHLKQSVRPPRVSPSSGHQEQEQDELLTGRCPTAYARRLRWLLKQVQCKVQVSRRQLDRAMDLVGGAEPGSSAPVRSRRARTRADSDSEEDDTTQEDDEDGPTADEAFKEGLDGEHADSTANEHLSEPEASAATPETPAAELTEDQMQVWLAALLQSVEAAGNQTQITPAAVTDSDDEDYEDDD